MPSTRRKTGTHLLRAVWSLQWHIINGSSRLCSDRPSMSSDAVGAWQELQQPASGWQALLPTCMRTRHTVPVTWSGWSTGHLTRWAVRLSSWQSLYTDDPHRNQPSRLAVRRPGRKPRHREQTAVLYTSVTSEKYRSNIVWSSRISLNVILMWQTCSGQRSSMYARSKRRALERQEIIFPCEFGICSYYQNEEEICDSYLGLCTFWVLVSQVACGEPLRSGNPRFFPATKHFFFAEVATAFSIRKYPKSFLVVIESRLFELDGCRTGQDRQPPTPWRWVRARNMTKRTRKRPTGARICICI